MKMIPVLFEDKNLIAVAKPSKMMVYEMGHSYEQKKCLLSKLEVSLKRPFYPVHWLDRACSGIVLLAKNRILASELSHAWSLKKHVAKFQVLVKGNFVDKGGFNFPLKDWTMTAQPALTSYQPIANYGAATLMEVQAQTECRHQIRRHFSRRCANVIGDKRYGQGRWNAYFRLRFGLNRIFMHCSYLEIQPKSYRNPLVINCTLPDDLVAVLQLLATAPLLVNSGNPGWVNPPVNTIAGDYH